MSDWRDVMDARANAERIAHDAAHTPLSTNDPGIMYAILSVAAELRALAVLIDYARGDAK